MTTPHFLLVGNGPYLNRGCEAIVRGTMNILRKAFGSNTSCTTFSPIEPCVVNLQDRIETDPHIRHCSHLVTRWSGAWFQRSFYRLTHPRTAIPHVGLLRAATQAKAALLVGGDNYSFDYGYQPWRLDIDRQLLACGIPVYLWGASVGPFESLPAHKREMLSHLGSLTGIFVRESASLRYLQQEGITGNVYRTWDPAFVLEAESPGENKLGFAMPESAVGFNLSPLIGNCLSLSYAAWVTMCRDMLRGVCAQTKRPVVLIPHVTSSHESQDDYRLLRAIRDNLRDDDIRSAQVFLVPPTLSAAETKWVISRCHILVAARTHATIAAFSSQVPTLSIAYSMKAAGLNQDLFGSQEHCLDAKDLGTATLLKRFATLEAKAPAIKASLGRLLPDIENRAYEAGTNLRQLLNDCAS